jgi:hypothetical protein
VVFILVQRTNAFFQRKQTFIDFRPVNSSLFVVISHIRPSFAPRQVNKGNLPMFFFAVS